MPRSRQRTGAYLVLDFKFGYASAGALVLFAIVLVVTLVQFQGEKKFTDYL